MLVSILIGILVAVCTGISLGFTPAGTKQVLVSACVSGLIVAGVAHYMVSDQVRTAHDAAYAEGRDLGEAEGARERLSVNDMKPGLYRVIGCVPSINAAAVTEPDGKTALYTMKCGAEEYDAFRVGQLYQVTEPGRIALASDVR